MNQASDRKPPSSHRRSARAARNRPVLVAQATGEESAYAGEDTAGVENVSTMLEESSPAASAAPGRMSSLRLPKFFSTVGKSEQATEEREESVSRARLARATRGKLNSSSAKVAEDANPRESKAEARPGAPARRPGGSTFKTRYLLGMGLYLIGANFIGIYITSFFASHGMDSVLARFPLFGGNVIIKSSTLVYLAVLVILLVVLARLDLIPRNFSSLGGQPPAARGGRGAGGGSASGNQEGVRSAPPTMRQGVKGADDDLYQQYRATQRRERKK